MRERRGEEKAGELGKSVPWARSCFAALAGWLV